MQRGMADKDLEREKGKGRHWRRCLSLRDGGKGILFSLF